MLVIAAQTKKRTGAQLSDYDRSISIERVNIRVCGFHLVYLLDFAVLAKHANSREVALFASGDCRGFETEQDRDTYQPVGQQLWGSGWTWPIAGPSRICVGRLHASKAVLSLGGLRSNVLGYRLGCKIRPMAFYLSVACVGAWNGRSP